MVRPRRAAADVPLDRGCADRLVGAGWKASLDAIAKEARKGRWSRQGQQPQGALDKGDRAAIDKAAAALSKAGGRNTVPGALGTEIRGHAAATANKVFAGENLVKVLTVGIAAPAVRRGGLRANRR